ncbi:hypothetical protein, conserved [Eimeria tenella]|uniref:Uncharacterized protein n=1 Tax=Eimeria tenella TaxID=5802 RepID=U6L1Y4_EIMTE|nr:hypothetical protein, conserved [Eimeria tenella]CDJ41780.1 hypothetical protein, conserved [Eimeria tenella]|eukprot:XP_013232530.1 hypothetical protein, conserved [Eimeria tenella]
MPAPTRATTAAEAAAGRAGQAARGRSFRTKAAATSQNVLYCAGSAVRCTLQRRLGLSGLLFVSMVTLVFSRSAFALDAPQIPPEESTFLSPNLPSSNAAAHVEAESAGGADQQQQQRVEAMKQLLPAAARLAAALGTEEAQELLKVAEALVPPPGTKVHPKELEAGAEILVSALSSLQSMAVARAAALAQQQEQQQGSFPELEVRDPPPQNNGELEVIDVADELEGNDTALTFLKLHRSLAEAAAQLQSSFAEVSHGVQTAQQFHTEADTPALAAAAADLELLSHFSGSLEHLKALATPIRDRAYDSMRIVKLRRGEEVLEEVGAELRLVNITMQLAEEAATAETAAAANAVFQRMEEISGDLETLLGHLRANIEQVRRSVTMKQISLASDRLEATAARASSLLENLKNEAKALPPLPAEIQSSSSRRSGERAIAAEADRHHENILAGAAAVRRALEDARKKIQSLSSSSSRSNRSNRNSKRGLQHVGSSISAALMRRLREISSQTESSVRQAESLVEAVPSVRSPEAALKSLRRLAEISVELVRKKEESQLLLLEGELVRALDKDAQHLVAAAAYYIAHPFDPDSREAECMQGDHKQFKEMMEMLSSAESVVDAEDLVSAARFAAASMRDTLAQHRRKDSEKQSEPVKGEP